MTGRGGVVGIVLRPAPVGLPAHADVQVVGGPVIISGSLSVVEELGDRGWFFEWLALVHSLAFALALAFDRRAQAASCFLHFPVVAQPGGIAVGRQSTVRL